MQILGMPVRAWATVLAGVVLLLVAAVIAWRELDISIVLQLAPTPESPK